MIKYKSSINASDIAKDLLQEKKGKAIGPDGIKMEAVILSL